MNSKGYAQILVIAIIVLGILMTAGIVTLPNLIIRPNYISNVEYPSNITRYQDFKVILTIDNPTSNPHQFNLDVSYDKGNWNSYNSYLSSGNLVPLDTLQPRQYTKYTLEFKSRRAYVDYGAHTFSFVLSEGEEILQTKIIEVNVNR